MSCGEKFICSLCSEEKTGKKYEEDLLGEKVAICKDCYEGLEELAKAFE